MQKNRFIAGAFLPWWPFREHPHEAAEIQTSWLTKSLPPIRPFSPHWHTRASFAPPPSYAFILRISKRLPALTNTSAINTSFTVSQQPGQSIKCLKPRTTTTLHSSEPCHQLPALLRLNRPLRSTSSKLDSHLCPLADIHLRNALPDQNANQTFLPRLPLLRLPCKTNPTNHIPTTDLHNTLPTTSNTHSKDSRGDKHSSQPATAPANHLHLSTKPPAEPKK